MTASISFDEPEAALSPQRQLAVLSHIHALVKKGSQLIVATHSPTLLAYPHATIYQCSADGLEAVEYEHTEAYTITREFLRARTDAGMADGVRECGYGAFTRPPTRKGVLPRHLWHSISQLCTPTLHPSIRSTP